MVSAIRIPVSQPSITNHEVSLVHDCLRRGWLTQGPMVARFEQQLAEWLGVRHVVACTSGTTALHLALVALGIGPGDEVLVPDLTFVATANAVRYCGGTPVLVDIDPATWCIDPADAERKVTPRTKAVIPVHLYGVIADMRALSDLASAHKLFVVEDAAEALGAQYRDFSGPWSDCATFSFYANKVITTGGEGGAVATSDHELDARLRSLRGQAVDPDRRYFHTAVGYNYRMTDVQAAFGVGQLERLDEMLTKRRAIMDRYRHLTARLACLVDAPCAQSEHYAPWQFTFAVPAAIARDALAAHLLAAGIDTRPTFVPLHRLPMYHWNHYGVNLIDEDFPVASRVGDTGLSLPTFADMSMAEVDEVCEVVLRYVEQQRSSNECQR